MNTQKYAIFLCALLASTFVHETLGRQALVPHSKNLGERSAKPAPRIAPVVKRSADADGLECGAANYGQNYSQFIVQNKTSNCAYVAEPESKMCAFLNGETGQGIVVDLDAEVYISVSGWDSSIQTCKEYLESIGSLYSLFDGQTGISCDNATSSDQSTLGEIVGSLSVTIKLKIQVDISLVFGLAVNLGLSIHDILIELTGILKFLLSDLIVTVFISIEGILNVLLGIGKLYGCYDGGLPALLDLDVVLDLDLAAILGSDDPFVNLSICLQALVNIGIDLDVFADVLNDNDSAISLWVQIGGGDNDGLSGLLNVILQIRVYLSGDIELDVLLQVLILFVCRQKNNNDSDLNLVNLQLLIDLCSDNAGLSVFVQLCGDLLDGTFSLSDIISILLSAVTDVLSTVILVVNGLLVNVVVTIDVLLSTVVLSLLQLGNTTEGMCEMNKAMDLKLDNDVISTSDDILGESVVVGDVDSILSTLLENVSVLLGSLLGGALKLVDDVVGNLLQIKLSVILGSIGTVDEIYAQCKSAVASNTDQNLDDCINESNTPNDEIRQMCNTILNVS